MRYLGKGSVSSVLQIALNVSWWVTIIAAVITGVGAIIGIINPSGLIHLGGKFHGDFMSLEFFAESNQLNAGQLRLVLVSSLFALIPLLGMGLVVIHNLRKVVGSLVDGDPFVATNVLSVRIIGWTILAWVVIQSLVEGIVGTILMNSLTTPGTEVRLDMGLNLTNVFFGLVILVLSEVFRIGVDLKDEQNLTI